MDGCRPRPGGPGYRRRADLLRDGWERVLIRRTVLAGAAPAGETPPAKEGAP